MIFTQKTVISAVILFLTCSLCSYGENILEEISDTLTLVKFKVLESEYSEGDYIDYSNHIELFSTYENGKLPKTLDAERNMYTFYTEFNF